MTDTLLATRCANRLHRNLRRGKVSPEGFESLPNGMKAVWWTQPEDVPTLYVSISATGQEVALITIPLEGQND